MSVNDIKVLRHGGGVFRWAVDDRTTTGVARTIKAGEPVYCTPGNSAYAFRGEDGTPKIATDIVLGIASRESTETSSANGEVEFISIIPGQTVLEGVATTKGNIDSAAELITYRGNYVLFDASYTKYSTTDGAITIDENDTDDPNVNGLCIIDGSADADGLVRVIVHANVLFGGALVGQTMD